MGEESRSSVTGVAECSILAFFARVGTSNLSFCRFRLEVEICSTHPFAQNAWHPFPVFVHAKGLEKGGHPPHLPQFQFHLFYSYRACQGIAHGSVCSAPGASGNSARCSRRAFQIDNGISKGTPCTRTCCPGRTARTIMPFETRVLA
jgi:hypothetical protein